MCRGGRKGGSGGGGSRDSSLPRAPRVVETLTLPVSRVPVLSVSLARKRSSMGGAAAGFSLGMLLRSGGSRGGPGPRSRPMAAIFWRARHRVLRCLKYKGRWCWGERATRVAGVWCERRTLRSSAGHPRCETHSLFRPPLFDRSLRVGGYWRRHETVCGGAISLSAPSLFLCRAACTCWA